MIENFLSILLQDIEAGTINWLIWAKIERGIAAVEYRSMSVLKTRKRLPRGTQPDLQRIATLLTNNIGAVLTVAARIQMNVGLMVWISLRS